MSPAERQRRRRQRLIEAARLGFLVRVYAEWMAGRLEMAGEPNPGVDDRAAREGSPSLWSNAVMVRSSTSPRFAKSFGSSPAITCAGLEARSGEAVALNHSGRVAIGRMCARASGGLRQLWLQPRDRAQAEASLRAGSTLSPRHPMSTRLALTASSSGVFGSRPISSTSRELSRRTA
jgi:hypothetical protein